MTVSRNTHSMMTLCITDELLHLANHVIVILTQHNSKMCCQVLHFSQMTLHNYSLQKYAWHFISLLNCKTWQNMLLLYWLRILVKYSAMCHYSHCTMTLSRKTLSIMTLYITVELWHLAEHVIVILTKHNSKMFW